MIQGLSHTNIRVQDIDNYLPFYVDVLGLTVSFDEDTRHSGNRGFPRRAVFLRWEGGSTKSFIVLQTFSANDEKEKA